MNLKQIYEDLNTNKPVNWTELQSNLAELATSKYWQSLKTLIESLVADLLTQSEDLKSVHEGQMDLEAYGVRAYIARVASDKIQSIISLVEQSDEAIRGNSGTAR